MKATGRINGPTEGIAVIPVLDDRVLAEIDCVGPDQALKKWPSPVWVDQTIPCQRWIDNSEFFGHVVSREAPSPVIATEEAAWSM